MRRRPICRGRRGARTCRGRGDAWAEGFELAFVRFGIVRRITYVWAGVVVVDVYADAAIGTEVDDVPFRVIWIGVVFLLSEEKDGVIVVSLERGAIHGEEFVPRLVDDLVDDKVVGYAWLGKSDGIVRHSIVERILDISQKILRSILGGFYVRSNRSDHQLVEAMQMWWGLKFLGHCPQK